MARSQKHVAIPVLDFSGGINTRFARNQLAENEVVDALNVHLEARGGAAKRPGYVPHKDGDTATTFNIDGLYQYKSVAGNTEIRIQNAKFEALIGGVWTDKTGTEVITAGNSHVFSIYRKFLIFTNGVDIPLKWDGTNNIQKVTTTITNTTDTLKKVGVLIRHGERIVYGDITQNDGVSDTRFESLIWGTNVGTLDTLDFNHVSRIHVGEGDGDAITAFADVGGFLIVFKNNSLWRVTNYGISGSQSVIKIAPVGAAGPHAVKVVGPLVFFVDPVGRFWVYDSRQGDTPDSLVEISAQKFGPDTFDTFVGTMTKKVLTAYEPTKAEVYALVPSFRIGQKHEAYVFNVTTGGFSRMEWDKDWSALTEIEDSTGKIRLLAGSSDGMVARLHEGLTDNGATFEAFVLTRVHHLGAMDMIKGFRDMDIYSRVSQTQNIELTLIKDLDQGTRLYNVNVQGQGAVLGSFILGTDKLSSEGEVRTRLRLDGFAKWAQFKFRQNVNQDIKFLGYNLYVVAAGEQRIK